MKIIFPVILILLVASLIFAAYLYYYTGNLEESNKLLQKDNSSVGSQIQKLQQDNEKANNQLQTEKSLNDNYEVTTRNFGNFLQKYGIATQYEEVAVEYFGAVLAKIQDAKYDYALTLIPQIRNSIDESNLELNNAMAFVQDQKIKSTIQVDLNNFQASRNLMINGIEKFLKVYTNPKYTASNPSKNDFLQFKSDLEKIKIDFQNARTKIDEIQNREYINIVFYKNYYDSIITALDNDIKNVDNALSKFT